MATAAATQDTRPAKFGGPLSWRPRLLKRTTPQRFAQMILDANQRHDWYCFAAGRRGCAFGLRADSARRSRLLFEPPQQVEAGPLVVLGETEIPLADIAFDTLAGWRVFLGARRHAAPEDAAFMGALFCVLGLT